MKTTRIVMSLRTKKNQQLPLFLIIRETYNKNGENEDTDYMEYVKIIFQIKGRKYRKTLKEQQSWGYSRKYVKLPVAFLFLHSFW